MKWTIVRALSLVVVAVGIGVAPLAAAPEAEAATSFDQISCGGAARLFQLREDGRELWYASVGNPANTYPRFYNWRKIYEFSASRPALAVAAHSVVYGRVRLFVTDRDGGLRLYGYNIDNGQVSVNNLKTGPGPYNFSRLASDGRRLYGTKGGSLYVMTGVTSTAQPRALAEVKTIGYPRALWGNAGYDQELMYTASDGMLRAVDVSSDSRGWDADITRIRETGWNQYGIASPGGGVIFRDVPDHMWRHLIDLPTRGTNTTITAHKTIANLNTPNEPITTPPETCGVDAAPPPSGNAFIDSVVPGARQIDRAYGIPASVAIGQAILESSWGNSTLARNDRNLFGIKCTSSGSPGPHASGCHAYQTTECTPTCHTVTAYFRVYRSYADSLLDYADVLRLPRYANAFDYTYDPDRFITELWRAGYATDPNYPSKVISLMRNHNLYRYNV